jgi:predicted peptidase
MFRIESFFSARSFVRPQEVGKKIYFISNLSGHLNLYAMDYGGSIPEPLLPSNIALQNPHLMEGYSFYVFEKLNQIIVMIDNDGDENYQPMTIPLTGGFPTPAFGNAFENQRVHLGDCDPEHDILYFQAESRQDDSQFAYQCNLRSGEIVKLGTSIWGCFPSGANSEHGKVILIDGYTLGDNVVYYWEKGMEERKLLYGIPVEQRTPDQPIQLNAISKSYFVRNDSGMVFYTAIFADTYGLGYMAFDNPQNVQPVEITGLKHSGSGELTDFTRLYKNRYSLEYNVDGCSWVYEGSLDENTLRLNLENVIVGEGELSNGVLDSIRYNQENDRYVLSFSTAISPTQIYTVSGSQRDRVVRHTSEKVLGIQDELLSQGEDASYTSFDGLRISARLYLPAEKLGFAKPYPLVFYVHGGPQGQERPDFAWFSMPLIQFLTLNGFAVFVPNVRGSTGYGMNFTKYVDKDWGGNDRLDHIHALKVLAENPKVDTSRAAVVGRSYGGYMTLTLAGRHPEYWSAAADMFGPYNLFTFLDRIPPTWKPYFKLAVGDPEQDRDLLIDRSPRTYIDQIKCPLLVIQGKNDPRVIEQESHDLVDHLRSIGKEVDYLLFENEGHDVLKYENRVKCYNTITEYFLKHLVQRS